jgi:hypothetical protein
MPHCPHSSDYVPCGFSLLPTLKAALKRTNSENEGDGTEILMMELEQIQKNDKIHDILPEMGESIQPG